MTREYACARQYGHILCALFISTGIYIVPFILKTRYFSFFFLPIHSFSALIFLSSLFSSLFLHSLPFFSILFLFFSFPTSTTWKPIQMTWNNSPSSGGSYTEHYTSLWWYDDMRARTARASTWVHAARLWALFLYQPTRNTHSKVKWIVCWLVCIFYALQI